MNTHDIELPSSDEAAAHMLPSDQKKSNLISIHWRWWWFMRVGGGYRFFSTMRVANALFVWIGPLQIIVRRRYPARRVEGKS